MQQLVPLQYIKQHFRIKIIKLTQIDKIGTVIFYHAVTDYGSMTFIIEHYQDTINGVKTIQFLNTRNKLLQSQSSNFALIYEQQVCINHPQQIVCLTLTQQCQIFCRDQYIHNEYSGRFKGKVCKLEKIMKTAKVLQQNQLGIDPKYGFQYFIMTTTKNQLNFDFTKILPIKHTFLTDSNAQYSQLQKQRYYQRMFKQVTICIKSLMQKYYIDDSNMKRLKEIIFVKDRIYKYDPSSLLKAQDYFELSFYLNIYQNKEVEVEYNVTSNSGSDLINQESSNLVLNEEISIELPKTKIFSVSSLEGNPTLIHNKKRYQNLNFLDGKCLNCLQEIFYQELAERFIVEGINTYRLYRSNLIGVKAKQYPTNIDQQISLKKKSSSKLFNEDNKIVQIKLIIYPTISKVQLIQFLIAYFNCIEPVIYKIVYEHSSHVLSLYLQNKHGQKRKFMMVFYKEYIIKDQQISIIIQKSTIKHCKLDIRFLKINDAFLYFLSNSEKMLKIEELYISDCNGMSDGGLNSFLISPYCKNLHTLNIISGSNIFETAIQAINKKSVLKNLILTRIKSNRYEQKERQQNSANTIDLSKLKFEQLQLRGITVNIERMLPTSLKILVLDQFISIQDMRNLRNLKLQQLTVKLSEPIQKKSIFTAFANTFNTAINPKNNPLRIFAQGESSGTLRKLNISQSTVKFKILRPLFWMKSLEKLIISNCPNLGPQFESIPASILHLCLQNNPTLTIENLKQILENTSILIELNIINTKINKKQLLEFLSGQQFSNINSKRNQRVSGKNKKIYVNNLIVSEHQYSNKLLEKSQKNHKKTDFEGIENIQVLLDQMLNSDQQHIFNYMLHKVSKTNKTLRLNVIEEDPIETIIKKSIKRKQNKSDKFKVDLDSMDSSKNKKDILIEKINKYLQLESSSMSKLKNLFIGGTSFEEVFIGFKEDQVTSDQLQFIDYSHLRHLKAQVSPIAQFSPRLKLSQARLNAPIDFIVNPKQTIDKITNKFVDLIKNNRELTNPINVYLKDNKVIDKNVIKMLVNYGSQRIRYIDFRGCLFQYQEVIEELFKFIWIQEMNNSQYEIILNKDNFITNSQKYLKMFMKIMPIKKLKISVDETEEVQILYSVLYHILDQHSLSIKSLTLHLNNININKQSQMFLEKIFQLLELQELDLTINNCRISQERYYLIWSNKLDNLSNRLKKLRLQLPSHQFPRIKLLGLQAIDINFSDEEVLQANLHKIIKNLHLSEGLRMLKLSTPNCQNISNLGKIFGSGVGVGNGIGGTLLQKISRLETLYLNIEYCPLKQSSFFEFLTGLSRCERLCYIQINISFAINNLNQLLTSAESMLSHLDRNINMRIICVTENSSKFVFNREQMCQNGVQFIL